MIPAWAVGDDEVRGWCRPGEHIISGHRNFYDPRLRVTARHHSPPSTPTTWAYLPSDRELPVIQIVYFLHLLSKFDAGGAGYGQVSS